MNMIRRTSAIAAVLLLLIAGLVAVGCGGGGGSGGQPAISRCTPNDYNMQCALQKVPSPPVTGEQVQTGRRGIDFAFGGPSGAWMRSQGYAFGASYLSTDNEKNWQPAQVADFARHGVARVFVWETSAERALGGCGAGATDARVARGQGSRFGFRVIYFAVDFELQRSEFGAVRSYFRCAAGVLGYSHTGAYGGVVTVELLVPRTVKYGWQTYAWSNGRWYRGAQLQQYQNDNAFDRDRAVAADYGQTPYRVVKRPSRHERLVKLDKQRAGLRVLLARHHCRPGRPWHGHARPRSYHTLCVRWLHAGQSVNKQIRALGGR